MIRELASELTRLCNSIDLIEQHEAKTVIEQALRLTRHTLKALIVEFRYLKNRPDPAEQSGVVKVFRRFAIDASSSAIEFDKKNGNKKQFEETESEVDYHIDLVQGMWNWVYETKDPVWIEDNHHTNENVDDKYLVNKAKENSYVPRKSRKVFEKTRSIIVIPFTPRLELASDVWGFLNVEFSEAKTHDEDLQKELDDLTKSLADVLWKSEAWAVNRDGTCKAVEEFKDRCTELWKDTRSTKTAFYAPCSQDSDQLTKAIEKSLREFGIEKNTYTSYRNITSLDDQNVMTAIRKAHIAVIDISDYDLNILLILGMLINQRKPCLILSDNADNQEVPAVLAAQPSSAVDPTYFPWRFYTYNVSTGGMPEFSCINGGGLSWGNIWPPFIEEVRRWSNAFRVAQDYSGT